MDPRNVITPQTTRGRISDEQFKFLRQYLSSRYGLRIAVEKKTLLESRLISRLNFLKLETIEAYLEYIFHSKEPNNEYQFFIEQITTHKTFFFREKYQFDFVTKILPGYWDCLPLQLRNGQKKSASEKFMVRAYRELFTCFTKILCTWLLSRHCW